MSENFADAFLMLRCVFGRFVRQVNVRSILAVVTTLGVFSVAALDAPALVVTTPAAGALDTTQPPPDNPPWNNVTVGSGTRNYTYLGNGWALSAWHVGPFIGEPPSAQTLTFASGVVSVIPNRNYDVPNLSGSGLSLDTDLKLVRINTDLGLNALTIAGPTPLPDSIVGTANAEVTIIGNGRTKQGFQSTYAGHPGYYTNADRVKQWGKNRIEDDGEGDPDIRVTVNIGSNENPRHIVSMTTEFNMSGGIDYEAQAVTEDSGSAVFRKNGAQWELIGIVNAVDFYDGQPFTGAFDGNSTTFADLTYYRAAIMNIMNDPEKSKFSITGDLNLDGVLSGDGTGPASTDDVTAFVQGWGYQHPIANENLINSWKKGDLNMDRVVNVSDFFAMRTALVAANLGAGAAALGTLLGTAVPEPASAVLAACAIGCGVSLRRRRSPLAA